MVAGDIRWLEKYTVSKYGDLCLKSHIWMEMDQLKDCAYDIN